IGCSNMHPSSARCRGAPDPAALRPGLSRRLAYHGARLITATAFGSVASAVSAPRNRRLGSTPRVPPARVPSARAMAGWVWPEQALAGRVRIGQVRTGQVRTEEVLTGRAWTGQARPGGVPFGRALSGPAPSQAGPDRALVGRAR